VAQLYAALGRLSDADQTAVENEGKKTTYGEKKPQPSPLTPSNAGLVDGDSTRRQKKGKLIKLFLFYIFIYFYYFLFIICFLF
jgi:hypothetical protein